MAPASAFVATAAIGTVLMVLLMLRRWVRRWLRPGRCHSEARMDGKTVIVTGSNTGIGKETAKDLARRGARVVMACRCPEKGQLALEDVVKASGNSNVVVRRLDLASIASIRGFVAEVCREEERVDVLINNAGVMMLPQSETEDGFETQFGTNHLGPFLLTHLLLTTLLTSAPSRIVNVSSRAHLRTSIAFDDVMLTRCYEPNRAYCQSKLANILFTRELARRLHGTGVTCYAVHPGIVHTDIIRNRAHFSLCWRLVWATLTTLPVMKTAEEGAQTSIYCSVDERAGRETGLYYRDCLAVEPGGRAKDDAAAKRLWDLSMKLVGLDSLD